MATCEETFYRAWRSPTVITLIMRLKLNRETAIKIKNVLTGKIDLMSFESARKRQEQAFHPHSNVTLALEVCNELLGGHGVEYISSQTDELTKPAGIDYVDMGDTYDMTLLYDNFSDVWSVGSWGEVVERDQKRFGE